MTDFTDEQMSTAIETNNLVKASYQKMKGLCKELQEKTGCPDEDVDNFLEFLIGKWQ